MVVGEGFEPSKAVPADLQSAPFGHSGTPPRGYCYIWLSPEKTSVATTFQIRWWWGKDSNLRRQCRQIYNLLPLATREPHHKCGADNSKHSDPVKTFLLNTECLPEFSSDYQLLLIFTFLDVAKA
ncbi:hypothetical protein VAS14_06448 [Photobacterium angustum S14]|uniref:Uncharacterized protein n=1 Tax=Photobacterium angustum (strain S14 / CCUG 15956) TaxID=314292 RepID=Q1ZRI8_PHOAS|nr:hypothetical protein VAS14_06448 [Photobacterium angustum S14]